MNLQPQLWQLQRWAVPDREGDRGHFWFGAQPRFQHSDGHQSIDSISARALLFIYWDPLKPLALLVRTYHQLTLLGEFFVQPCRQVQRQAGRFMTLQPQLRQLQRWAVPDREGDRGHFWFGAQLRFQHSDGHQSIDSI